MSHHTAIRENESPLTSEASGIASSLVRPERSPGLIVNADDWGRDSDTTNRTLDCFLAGAISSVSAMVFMEDSQRAADIVRAHGIDVGLHLNFTTPYSAPNCPDLLKQHQQKIAAAIKSHRFAPALYRPGLAASFEYVVKAQMDEFHRLHGAAPIRFDGHHHMHLCSNVLRQRLLPQWSIVRRNLSFGAGEKHLVNRLYRRMQDRRLARRHQLADFFFDINPVQPPSRIRQIFELGARFNVEVEVHPIRDEEYRFLMSGEILRFASEAPIARGYALRLRHFADSMESIA